MTEYVAWVIFTVCYGLAFALWLAFLPMTYSAFTDGGTTQGIFVTVIAIAILAVLIATCLSCWKALHDD